MPSLKTRVEYDLQKQEQMIEDVEDEIENIETIGGTTAQDLADLEQQLRDGGVIP